MMPPEHGYQRALEILETRYGDSFEITQRWITKITDRPNIKGPADLRDFADDLQCCQEMVRNMGHLGDLDNTFSMRSIWKKLPQYLQDRWAHRNYEIKKRQVESKVELKDLVEFVVEAAEEATDPVFSRFSFMDSKCKETSYKPTKQASSFSTTSNPSSSSNKTPSEKCPCCEQKHYITQCGKFKAMRIKERRDLVMKKGLCMNCFAKGRLTKDCPRDFTCSVDGCGLKHSKFLHLKPRLPVHDTEVQINTTINTPAVSNQQMSPTALSFQPSQPVPGSSHFTHSHRRKLAMPIVAARVWNPESGVYRDTYALLDPGSNGTYCTSSLQEKLGVRGTAHSMELTTLTASRMHLNTTVVTLDITSMNDKTCYTVNAVVRPDLNIDNSGISSQLDIEKWPHLSDLTIPEVDGKSVDLLIGQDSSLLLVPEEIRRGNNGEPFALLTPLGWAINRPIDVDGKYPSSSHFVQTHAPLEKDLKKLWNEDVHAEDRTWSKNDENTIAVWNKSLQIVDKNYNKDIPLKNNSPDLPNNRQVAEKRDQSLSKRLEKDPEPEERYTPELIDKGYAEQVPEDDMRKESQLELKGTTATFAVKQEADHTSYLLNYFSSWTKLKKAVVWYRRFQQYLQRNKTQSGPVTVEEIKGAENAILRYTQKTLVQENLQLRKLDPVTGEDGLIKVGGRLVNSHFQDDTIHPVILPYKHHVSELIIKHSHHVTGHAGVERVLAETRKRVWIMKGRKLVKSIVHRCMQCKSNHGKTEVQKMADLSESQVTLYEPPFSRAGVDYL